MAVMLRASGAGSLSGIVGLEICRFAFTLISIPVVLVAGAGAFAITVSFWTRLQRSSVFWKGKPSPFIMKIQQRSLSSTPSFLTVTVVGRHCRTSRHIECFEKASYEIVQQFAGVEPPPRFSAQCREQVSMRRLRPSFRFRRRSLSKPLVVT
jgi:hypothetical protein